MEYVKMNNGRQCPVIGIGTFTISPADAEVSVREALTDDEMAEIAKLNKGVRYYTRTDEQLAQFAVWQPQYEKA